MNAVVRALLLSFGLAGGLCAPVAEAGGDDSYVVPGSRAADLESCVEPTDYMRRNHMEVIKHQRDETVHQGIRSTKHSLAGCIECHVAYGDDGIPTPVNAREQFCQSCHRFAAVRLACFDCHATTPDHTEIEPTSGHDHAAAMPFGLLSADRLAGLHVDRIGGGVRE